MYNTINSNKGKESSRQYIPSSLRQTRVGAACSTKGPTLVVSTGMSPELPRRQLTRARLGGTGHTTGYFVLLEVRAYGPRNTKDFQIYIVSEISFTLFFVIFLYPLTFLYFCHFSHSLFSLSSSPDLTHFPLGFLSSSPSPSSHILPHLLWSGFKLASFCLPGLGKHLSSLPEALVCVRCFTKKRYIKEWEGKRQIKKKNRERNGPPSSESTLWVWDPRLRRTHIRAKQNYLFSLIGSLQHREKKKKNRKKIKKGRKK